MNFQVQIEVLVNPWIIFYLKKTTFYNWLSYHKKISLNITIFSYILCFKINKKNILEIEQQR